MGKRKAKAPRGPHIFWRNGRAYADFRAYADVGGTKSALAEQGQTWGTADEAIALALFEAELAKLKAKKSGKVGAPQQQPTTLAKLVQHHLVMKAKADTSESHLYDLEKRLAAAISFFGAGRDPGTILPDDVRAWGTDLAKGGKRKPGTVRHYLNALSGLYRRAQEGLHVNPGYNPVAALVEKPTGKWRGETNFFEVHEAALILEAARVVDARQSGRVGDGGNRVNATEGLHPIVATMLLTGGRRAEVLGLDVDDVSFDRGVIYFRPNAHRRLKTLTSERQVPMQPQLREILQEWIFGGEQPRTTGLLFPASHGGMVRDLRKSLAAVAALCELDEDEVHTRRFRTTYCSARLQCVQRILRPGRQLSDPDAFDWVEVSKFTVAKEMGHGGTQLVDRIYGHAQRSPYRSEVVEYRVEQHREQLGERLTALAARA